MKKFNISLLFLSIAAIVGCGVFKNKSPSTVEADIDYYASVDTSSRQKLMDSLESRLNSGAYDVGYDGLFEAYKKTDVKPGTNYLWDMYSNINYTTTDSRINKNYSKEGDSINREHGIPQSWFKEKSPMKADMFHVYPTDGYVNNKRSNYPHGQVGNATYTSQNGSKLGSSNFPGISGTVFEPIDEYKGDFARTYFYMATRYASKVGGWGGSVFESSFPHIDSDFIELYYKWHINDPVSSKETNRNEAVYLIQKNRNPYIDHPEWVGYVFKGITPTPEAKTLTAINVTSVGSKREYEEGDSFDKTSIKVTATFNTDSGTKTEDVTSSVTISPSTLSLSTTKVTISYSYNGVTKTADFSNFTVKSSIYYGSYDDPLTVGDSLDVIKTDCLTIGSYTKEKIYCAGVVKSIGSKLTSTKFSQVKVEDILGDDEILLDTINMSESQADKFAVGRSIEFHGYGYKSGTSSYIFKNYSSNYVTLDDMYIPVESLDVSLEFDTYHVGDTAKINVTISPTDASITDIEYSSLNESVASVDCEGNVLFKKIGTATFKVISVDDESLTKIVSCNVIAKPVVIIDVEEIKLNPTALKLEIGEKESLETVVLPENATDKSIFWSSDNPEIAEVNNLGTITAISEGSARIEACSADGKVKSYCDVTVIKRVAPLDPNIVEIKVTRNPYKTIYDLNDEFNQDGLLVEAHYIDGRIVNITHDVILSNPSMSFAGIKTIDVTYKDELTTHFKIAVLNNDVSELNIVKNPVKTHYFHDEPFNPTGIKVNAKIGEKTIDVTSMVNYEYDFEISGSIKLSFANAECNFNVIVENGKITKEHKAAEFIYVFKDVIGDSSIHNINIGEWRILEHYFNRLDNEAKDVLKTTITDFAGGVEASEQLSDIIKENISLYDQIILERQTDGFTDFISRNPKTPSPKNPDSVNIKPVLIGIGIGIIVLVILIIFIASIRRHKRKTK